MPFLCLPNELSFWQCFSQIFPLPALLWKYLIKSVPFLEIESWESWGNTWSIPWLIKDTVQLNVLLKITLFFNMNLKIIILMSILQLSKIVQVTGLQHLHQPAFHGVCREWLSQEGRRPSSKIKKSNKTQTSGLTILLITEPVWYLREDFY